jgi:long-subunit fatty acid transport protein
MHRFPLFFACLWSVTASAGSITAPGVIAGPDSGPAKADAASAHYNPAALGALTGATSMLDVQIANIRIDATSTRNGGIDPNTGNAYGLSSARVQVPAFMLGVAAKVHDKVGIGLSITDAYVGGGDYTHLEEGTEPPFTGHQRYAGVQTKLVTVHIIPAVGVNVLDGIHVGGGPKIVMDMIDALQASDPLGSEGVGIDGPYSMDSYLAASASGMHMGWNVGLYVDRFEPVRLGVTWEHNGTFEAEGTGTVMVPNALTTIDGSVTVDALTEVSFPLPDVLRFWVDTDLNEKLTVGAGMDHQMWSACCGGPEGDIFIGVTSTDGDAIGAADDIVLEIGTDNYSPRRLWSSSNYSAAVSYQQSDKLWLGGRAGYNQNAVPNYAVSATNLDFENIGAMMAGRYTMGKLTVGLSYAKFMLFERVITNSAWDVRDEEDGHYADDRFSPKTPFKASANGTFKGDVDVFGVRISADF